MKRLRVTQAFYKAEDLEDGVPLPEIVENWPNNWPIHVELPESLYNETGYVCVKFWQLR